MTGASWQMNMSLRLAGQYLAPGNVRPAKANVADQISQVMGYGTGSDQMTQILLQDRTLGAGASELLDLYDGTTNSPQLRDIGGWEAIAFRNIKGFSLWISDGGDTAGVTVGAAGSNPNTLWFGGTTPTQTVYPGGAAMSGGSDAGKAVTTSARYVKVLNNGAVQVTYTVAIGGVQTVGGSPMGMMLLLTYP